MDWVVTVRLICSWRRFNSSVGFILTCTSYRTEFVVDDICLSTPKPMTLQDGKHYAVDKCTMLQPFSVIRYSLS